MKKVLLQKAYAIMNDRKSPSGGHVPIICAIVLGFLGILAIHKDLLGGPFRPAEASGSSVETMLSRVLDPILKPRLSPLEEVLLDPEHLEPLPPETIDSETLWLARAIFSETKRPEEQVLVAWVIRNRVETAFRGQKTYEGVVLDPHQFSAFKTENPLRSFYTGLTPRTDLPGWDTALSIAFMVRNLDDAYRPFPLMTRHFYSERSMQHPDPPNWARNQKPVQLDTGVLKIDQRRFRFFNNVS